MRISDWSSDVCSSDLLLQAASQETCRQNVDPVPGGVARGKGAHGGASSRVCSRVPQRALRYPSSNFEASSPHARISAIRRQPSCPFNTRVLPPSSSPPPRQRPRRSEEDTSELQSLMRITY